jgi:hypothetical protein
MNLGRVAKDMTLEERKLPRNVLVIEQVNRKPTKPPDLEPDFEKSRAMPGEFIAGMVKKRQDNVDEPRLD